MFFKVIPVKKSSIQKKEIQHVSEGEIKKKLPQYMRQPLLIKFYFCKELNLFFFQNLRKSTFLIFIINSRYAVISGSAYL